MNYLGLTRNEGEERRERILEAQCSNINVFDSKKRYIKVVVPIKIQNTSSSGYISSYFESGLHTSARSVFHMKEGWKIQSIKKAIPSHIKKLFLEKYKTIYNYELKIAKVSLYKSGYSHVILKISPICFPLPSQKVISDLSQFIHTKDLPHFFLDEDWVITVKDNKDWIENEDECEGWASFHPDRCEKWEKIEKVRNPGKWRVETNGEMYSYDRRLS